VSLTADDKYVLWDKIEEGITKYSVMGDTMLIGDFNSRIGNVNETLECSTEIDNLSGVYHAESLVNRNTQDNVVNQFGRKLLDLCRHTNMCILNGRSLGDIQGQPTSYQYNGSSIIDYCVVKRELFRRIMYFTVLTPSHVSDHSSISICVDGVHRINQTNYSDETKFSKLPCGYKWDVCKNNYENIINSPHFVTRLDALCNDNYNIDCDGINQLCHDVTSVLTDAACQSLKRVKLKRGTKPQEKWYTGSLHSLKCSIAHLGKLLQRYPNDPFIRGKFILKKK
jgi:hypothetical protein